MALAVAGAGTYGVLNGYWGQSGGPNLRTYCDSGIQYATLAFVNLAPENDKSGSGYPGINFSSHCWAESFPGKNGKGTQLLSHCQSLKDDIPYCQSKGVKVILSIGGEYKQPESDYQVTTDKNGEDFAEFLYKAFGPYRDDWAGPRPFDRPDQHVFVDGFDFDIEAMFDNGPYIAMINKLRALDKSLLITGAPQCPTNPKYFQMKELVEKAAFDALFIQFYNNPSCDAVPSKDPGDGFNLDDWVEIVAQSRNSKSAKLFVGLPASPNTAGSGYIGPQQVKDLVCRYKDRKNFGGISLWDLGKSRGNVSGGKSFHEHVLDALRYGCGPMPTSSSSIARTLTTKATSTSKPYPTVSTGKPISTTARGTGQLSSSGIASTVVSSTARWSKSNSTATSATSAPMMTRTVYTTKVHTISSCPPEVTNCPLSHKTGLVVTETVPLYTTVFPEDQTTFPPEPTAAETSPRATTTKPAVTGSSVSLTTSIVYTTKTQTVTSCVPWDTDCHKGQVLTETVPLYTTVCPVTQTAQPPRSTSSEMETPSPLTTSTVYTTTSYTITSCLPGVPNCPTGKVVTAVIPLHTTVCPAEETETETAKVSPSTPSGPDSVSRPESTASSQTATATSIRNTVAVPVSSTLETLAKPASETPVSPAHPGPGCSGPGCPGGASRPATTTIYTTIAVPGPSSPWTYKRPAAEAPNPGPGCSGPGCSSGIAAATESPSGRPVRPSATQLTPVVAGASSLAVSLTGLIAVMAVQVLAL